MSDSLSRLAPEPLVVIAAFRLHDEAQIAKMVLDRAGVASEARAYDESVERRCDGVFPSGVDLVVAEGDAERAIALVQRMFREEEGERAEVFARCPACGSLEVTRLRRLLLFTVAAVALFIGGALTGERDLFMLMIAIVGGILLLSRENRCRTCGERWRGGREPIAPEDAIEVPDVPCPKCGSGDTDRLRRRREKATTLLVNMLVPPLLFVWPFLPKRKCVACGHEWR